VRFSGHEEVASRDRKMDTSPPKNVCVETVEEIKNIVIRSA